jgi:predicted O-linked N-acetylglucosamine transferase (SPINDLY family)
MDPSIARAIQLFSSGRREEAIQALAEAVKGTPRNAQAHVLLGDWLKGAARNEEALAEYDRALAADSRCPGVHVRRAFALRDLERFREAEAAAQKSIQFEPSNFNGHLARVSVLYTEGNLIDAAEFAQQSLRVKPDSVELAYSAAMSLILTGSANKAAQLLGAFLKAKPDAVTIRDTLNTAWTYASATTPEQRTQGIIDVARLVFGRYPRGPIRPPTDPDPERSLRIGYLAQDISERSAIAYFIAPIFEHHDRERYPVTCYLTQRNMGVMTPHMLGHLKNWVDVGEMSDADAATRIREDKIDILVDLAGNTPGNRLPVLLLRPAPVIVTAIGCPQTSGLDCVDYRLVDEVTDPAGYEKHWVEKLVRLPGCFLCYRSADDAPPARPPRHMGSTEPITFGSLNVLQKTGPEVIALWARILKAVKGSRLLLKASGLSHPRTRAAFLKRLSQQGIGADRVELLGRTESYPEHLQLYQRVDIALDPFPYNGTTTACEALWMGVPFIALLGDMHAGRVGASLLTAVGLEELIAPSADAYVKIASDLATDSARLEGLHADLRGRMANSILCDGAAHAKSLEAAYRDMWRARCAAQGPGSR